MTTNCIPQAVQKTPITHLDDPITHLHDPNRSRLYRIQYIWECVKYTFEYLRLYFNKNEISDNTWQHCKNAVTTRSLVKFEAALWWHGTTIVPYIYLKLAEETSDSYIAIAEIVNQREQTSIQACIERESHANAPHSAGQKFASTLIEKTIDSSNIFFADLLIMRQTKESSSLQSYYLDWIEKALTPKYDNNNGRPLTASPCFAIAGFCFNAIERQDTTTTALIIDKLPNLLHKASPISDSQNTPWNNQKQVWQDEFIDLICKLQKMQFLTPDAIKSFIYKEMEKTKTKDDVICLQKLIDKLKVQLDDEFYKSWIEHILQTGNPSDPTIPNFAIAAVIINIAPTLDLSEIINQSSPMNAIAENELDKKTELWISKFLEFLKKLKDENKITAKQAEKIIVVECEKVKNKAQIDFFKKELDFRKYKHSNKTTPIHAAYRSYMTLYTCNEYLTNELVKTNPELFYCISNPQEPLLVNLLKHKGNNGTITKDVEDRLIPFLLKQPTILNLQNALGDTVLHYIAQQCVQKEKTTLKTDETEANKQKAHQNIQKLKDILEILILSGANTQIKNKANQTATSIYEKGDRDDIKRLLQEPLDELTTQEDSPEKITTRTKCCTASKNVHLIMTMPPTTFSPTTSKDEPGRTCPPIFGSNNKTATSTTRHKTQLFNELPEQPPAHSSPVKKQIFSPDPVVSTTTTKKTTKEEQSPTTTHHWQITPQPPFKTRAPDNNKEQYQIA